MARRKVVIYFNHQRLNFAIDHRTIKIGLPVRSAVLKNCAGRLVVGWVITSVSLLLIVFASLPAGVLDIYSNHRSVGILLEIIGIFVVFPWS
jgi:hypothetical protein